MHCFSTFHGGGIPRIKLHLAGVVGEVKSCKKMDADTKFRMQENLNVISSKKKSGANTFDDVHPFGPNVVELDEDDPNDVPHSVVTSSSRSTKRRAVSSQGMTKSFFAPRTTFGAQPTIKSVLADKEVIHKVDIAIATFFL